MSLAVAILAGGKSKRMGCDKTLLEIDGIPILKRIIDVAEGLSQECLIISNTPHKHDSFGWPILSDSYGNTGPLGGLYTALKSINSERLLLLACDMPYMRYDFLNYITTIYTKKDAVVPFDHLPQPLCSVYKTTLISTIDSLIKKQRLSMRYFLKQIDVLQVLPDQWSHLKADKKLFANINTPEDYATINDDSRTLPPN
tara:strand:+ start:1859 stop:2455 length:597 start_codon:yes stop_codon:yes gene_type:complete